MKHISQKIKFMLLFAMVFNFNIKTVTSQEIWDRIKARPQTMDVTERRSLENSHFKLELLKSSHIVAKMNPTIDATFDFVPSELLEIRSRDSLYHLGDVNIMYRFSGDADWKAYSSARKREPVKPMEEFKGKSISGLVSSRLKEADKLSIIREWSVEKDELTLTFEFKNDSEKAIEIGYLGIPMIFDNILHGKNLEEAHLEKVFYDPYIGGDAGYLQVVRLHGKSPVLLVVPDKNASFEAYSPLLDDRTPRNITFEGFHDWVIHSKAKAEHEWKEADQWIKPSSKVIEPGQSYKSSLKFMIADNVQSIESKLIAKERPVAIGLPGYVIAKDVAARLQLKAAQKVKSINVFPKDALSISKSNKKDKKGWDRYDVKGLKWGRARVEVTYDDGSVQVLSYKVIDSESELIAKMGAFYTNQQWFEDEKDPFGRHQSVISYDYEKKAQVKQDSRAWIPGLSDEAGAGSWLAAMMKQVIDPKKDEVAKMNTFMHEVLWGGIQYNEGPKQYGVKKSVFFYEPDSMPEGTYSSDINYNTWAAWDKKHADDPGRSYNYPHVAAAHWVMYRLSRYYEGFDLQEPWDWYLTHAYHTSVAMVKLAPHYAQFGQMEGTIFLMILEDLKRESMNDFATDLENIMKARADVWASLAYPFGSEMPWDSTGQEEVYMWAKYFGMEEKADVTLNAILAYMPTIPHWGYNGSARRYWDFLYGGKIQRVERQLHHYGSALNAIPVLHEYIQKPEDLYLLRVGYAGMIGGIANVTEDGFGPSAFHSYPETLEIDGLSGDYGSGFFGYAINSKSILKNDPIFGWIGFGGNVTEKSNKIQIDLTTAAKQKLFIAPEELMISLASGKILNAEYDIKSKRLKIRFEAKSEFSDKVYFQLDHPTKKDWGIDLKKLDNGMYIYPLSSNKNELELRF
ncbi:DUF5695 domain-containing protein [Belliella sp. DSM 111904]|uniref:DUF5695 domain-containing protein n=1 Tax=Belliella filtrata TaxID=2923435 RepID=A0ABS9V439_9BACT|nr:DUF5695 domain-containing protein [Belliella filtrata]MCH7411181.1 DUF5695 domain-containing protein [Belliella filtrata]